MQTRVEPPAHKTKRFKLKPWLKITLSVVVAVGIFVAGWGVGSGRIGVAAFGGPQSLNKQLPNSLDFSSVNMVYQALKGNFDGELSEQELLDGLKSGLVKAAGDPYTEYLNEDRYDEFSDALNGSFEGIGAELGQDDDGNIEVVAPISGYPAEKAGLRGGDIIIKVDDTFTTGMTVTEAVEKIRGPKDTTVTLTVIRGGQQLELAITRDTIVTPSVHWEVEGGIGYMQISRFNAETGRLARQAAEDFKQQNVTGVVVDLRNNIGGLTTGAVDISSLWLPKGTVVLTERRGGDIIATMRATGDPVLQGIPAVVLINGGTASSAEIVAGALHDNGAATLVGTKTYGKGSVQKLVNVGSGGVLKVTVARWYTPDGKNIDKEGITPDKEVTISEEDIQNGRDPQEAAALENL